MNQFQPPPNLSLQGNVSENWHRFKQQFNIYLVASGWIEKSAKVKAMTLLHVIGSDAFEVYNTFKWGNEEDKEAVEDILEKFEQYCSPQKNITYERHIFNCRAQVAGETTNQYVTDLKIKAGSCEFGDLKESLIKDRIVCGIRSDQVRGRLLRDPSLTLIKAIEICRSK